MDSNEFVFNENQIRKEFGKFTDENLATYSKVVPLIVIPTLLYYIWNDLGFRKLPEISALFRSIPIAFSLLMLAIHLTPFKRNYLVIRIFYMAMLSSNMVMMAGLLAITVGTEVYSAYVMGTVVMIFCVYVGSFYGMKSLIPIYFVPMTALIFYYVFARGLPFHYYGTLANPFTTAIVCIVLSEYQGKLRFREFRLSKIIESQNIRLNKDLELAREIQNCLIPAATPSIKGVELCSVYTPMTGIGGDFFDYIETGDSGSIGIFISDVSGHGVSAALIASMVKTLIITSGEQKNSPGKLLTYINEKLIGHTNENFVTAFYGIYNSANMELRYARGGHVFPLLISNTGVTELKSEGKVLGIINDLLFEEISIKLGSGDQILFYTDGLTDAINRNNVPFSVMLLSEIIQPGNRLGNKEFVNNIYDHLLKFCGKDYFDDDVCIVGMKIK